MKNLILFGSILVLCFGQAVVGTSFNYAEKRMNDVNSDWIVDISDISSTIAAYGSYYTFYTEPNKTVVTVLDFSRNPPEVENARVAIFDPNFTEYWWDALEVNYTDSYGTVAFSLEPHRSYTAIAWDDSAYNYADFTTNSLGEASAVIVLKEAQSPIFHHLPRDWIAITFISNETGSLFTEEFLLAVYDIVWNGNFTNGEPTLRRFGSGSGVFVLPVNPVNEPHQKYGLILIDVHGRYRGCAVYSPDENGCANVVIYVTPP